LDGQAALVTGGGGGIGGASAEWLARDGAAVMIMGRTEATLVESKKRIETGRRRRRAHRVLRGRRGRRESRSRRRARRLRRWLIDWRSQCRSSEAAR
jgi:NAD(P)-dependent dehydrogenase (short-subunit alcohol dehydrogenase family)